MSDQDGVESVGGEEGEGTALSTSDDVQGVSAETEPQLDDVVNSEEDTTKAAADDDGDISHPPDQCEVPDSGLEERAAIEEATVVQPLSAEGDGDEEETATSSVESLRYANPYGTFITGIDVNSEEAALKRSQRAARFGLSREEGEEGGGGRETVEKRQDRAKRFGTKLLAHQGQPIKLVDKLPEIPNGDLRPGVLHLYGTDEMSTADVFSYFQAYPPRNIEWINDSSCNAVWEDAESASRALCGLTNQPVVLRSKFTEEEPQPMETSDPSPSSPSPLSGSDDNPPRTTPAEQPEFKVQWHLGVNHPKAKQLLLRCAVEGDVKVSGAAQRSNYYRKYGNPNKRVGARTPGMSSGGVSGGKGGGKTWREKQTTTDLEQRVVKLEDDSSLSNPTASTDREVRTWREEPTTTDLRHRLGKRARDGDGETGEAMEVEVGGSEADSLAGLVKRPKPLHSERTVEEVEERLYLEDSEKERMGREVKEVTNADLRKRIQKKRKKRELKLRVGANPRIVERTT